MRKLILSIHSTFNGIVTGDPSKDKTDFRAWTADANIEASSKILLKMFDTVDTILLGRGTYEDLARKWPSAKDWPQVSDVGLRLAEKINNASKLVVTGDPLDELKWGEFAAPKQLTGNNIEEQIKELKNGDGGDIIIFGSPKLVQSLTDANLIDEYQILVHPVVVNKGEHLFDNLKMRKDFHLVDVKTFEDDAILVTYKPAEAA
jgi:dihydrofolate reductase